MTNTDGQERVMNATAPRRLLYPIEEAGRMLGVGRTTIYGLVDRGELETVKIGRRALVTAESLTDLVDRLTTAARAGGDS